MKIKESLIKLRDDFVTWVSNNLKLKVDKVNDKRLCMKSLLIMAVTIYEH